MPGKNVQQYKNKQNNKNPCHQYGNHLPYDECKFIKMISEYCHSAGYIAKTCNSKKIKYGTVNLISKV